MDWLGSGSQRVRLCSHIRPSQYGESVSQDARILPITDRATQTFTMEKVDTTVGVNFNGRSVHGPRGAASRTFVSTRL